MAWPGSVSNETPAAWATAATATVAVAAARPAPRPVRHRGAGRSARGDVVDVVTGVVVAVIGLLEGSGAGSSDPHPLHEVPPPKSTSPPENLQLVTVAAPGGR